MANYYHKYSTSFGNNDKKQISTFLDNEDYINCSYCNRTLETYINKPNSYGRKLKYNHLNCEKCGIYIDINPQIQSNNNNNDILRIFVCNNSIPHNYCLCLYCGLLYGINPWNNAVKKMEDIEYKSNEVKSNEYYEYKEKSYYDDDTDNINDDLLEMGIKLSLLQQKKENQQRIKKILKVTRNKNHKKQQSIKLSSENHWKANVSKSNIMKLISNIALLQDKQINCQYMFPQNGLQRLIKLYNNKQISVIYTFNNLCDKKDLFNINNINSGIIFLNNIIKYYGIKSLIHALCRPYNVPKDVINLCILYFDTKRYTDYKFVMIEKVNQQTSIINEKHYDYDKISLKYEQLSNVNLIKQRLANKLNHKIFVCLMLKLDDNDDDNDNDGEFVSFKNILPIYRIEFKTQYSIPQNLRRPIRFPMKHWIYLNIENIKEKYFKKLVGSHYGWYTDRCWDDQCVQYYYHWHWDEEQKKRVQENGLCLRCKKEKPLRQKYNKWLTSFPNRLEMKGFPIKLDKNVNNNRYLQRKWSAYHKLNSSNKFTVSHYTQY